MTERRQESRTSDATVKMTRKKRYQLWTGKVSLKGWSSYTRSTKARETKLPISRQEESFNLFWNGFSKFTKFQFKTGPKEVAFTLKAKYSGHTIHTTLFPSIIYLRVHIITFASYTGPCFFSSRFWQLTMNCESKNVSTKMYYK